MKYYELMYDYENSENYADCGDCDIGNMDRYIIYDGKKINDWENVEFEYDAKEGDILTDYLLNVLIVRNLVIHIVLTKSLYQMERG